MQKADSEMSLDVILQPSEDVRKEEEDRKSRIKAARSSVMKRFRRDLKKHKRRAITAQWIDKTVKLDIKRLHKLHPDLKLNLGGMFVSCLITSLRSWLRVDRTNKGYAILVPWCCDLTTKFLDFVIAAGPVERQVIMQNLEIQLPGGAEGDVDRDPPDPAAHSDILLTHQEDLREKSDEFNDSPPPPPQMVWLRDMLVAFVVLSGKESDSTSHLYSARTRYVLQLVGIQLGVPTEIFCLWERGIGAELYAAVQTRGAEVEARRAADSSRSSRKMKVGLAALGGGAILALTGGLAAPALVAGLSTLGTSIAATGSVGAAIGGVFLTGGAVFASLGAAGAVAVFGAGGGALTAWKMSDRLGDLKEFSFIEVESRPSSLESGVDDEDNVSSSEESKGENPNESCRHSHLGALQLSVCVSGWIANESSCAFVEPWKSVGPIGGDVSDVFAVKWESSNLFALTSFMAKMLASEVAVTAASFWLHSVVTGGLTTASAFMWPVWVIRYMSDLNNTWQVVGERAKLAGKALAAAITDRATVGHRPIRLVGFGMGARVVFNALQELHKRDEFHTVSDVFLIGAPISTTFVVPSDYEPWFRARAVVSGRFVNGYCSSDWLLGFLYRYMEWSIHASGLRSVTGVPGVENVDLSDVIEGHHEYLEAMTEVLAKLEFGTEHLIRMR